VTDAEEGDSPPIDDLESLEERLKPKLFPIVFEKDQAAQLVEEETRIPISKNTCAILIFSLHLACLLSRPAEMAYNSEVISLISTISWTIYSLLIPGLVILLYHRKGSLENSDFIFIPALSLLWILLIGLIVNGIGVLLDVNDPLQWWTTGYLSLISTASIFEIYRLRNFRGPSFELVFIKTPNSVLICCIIVIFLGITGPLAFRDFGSNTLSLLAILIISLSLPLINRGSAFGDNLALYSCALSLMLIHTLSTDNLNGGDIQVEYFFSNAVISSEDFEVLSYNRYSAALGTKTIIPILSLWTGLSLTSTLRIIYPMIYSFVPILLNYSYNQVFERRVSFYASLISIFSWQYYTIMADLVRQGISEVFLLSVFVLISSSESLRMYRLRVFTVPLLAGMILSHYSIGYVLLPLLWGTYIANLFSGIFWTIESEDETLEMFRQESEEDEEGIMLFSENVLLDEEGLLTMEELQRKVNIRNPALNFSQLSLATIILLTWHAIAGGGVILRTITSFSVEIMEKFSELGILGAIFSTQPTQTVVTTLDPLHEITKLLYILITLASIFGIYIFRERDYVPRNHRNLFSMAIASWIILIPFFIIPSLAIRLEFGRLFHWFIMFLAPFSIIAIDQLSSRVSKFGGFTISSDILSMVTPSILSFFLIFSSGFAYQFSDEQHKMAFDQDIDWYVYSDSELSGASWSANIVNPDDSIKPCISSDYFRSVMLAKYNGRLLLNSRQSIEDSQFVFISGTNLIDSRFSFREYVSGEVWEKREYFVAASDFSNSSVIYDSGDSHWHYRNDCKVDNEFLQISGTN
jgi:uncharacterized membrane protein